MYTIHFSHQAQKFLAKQPAASRDRIRAALMELARDPFAHRQVKRLRGSDLLLRLRVGDVRVVFSIEQEALLILVLSIGNRQDVYRRL